MTMKKIVCEMCEGTDFLKQGGLFICQGCGCKYSIEEAKNMMREISSGSVQVTGITKTDNDMLIKNYIEIANSAVKSKNYREAELYCNKVLEINVNHNLAWLIKGNIAAQTSTIDNLKFDEMVNCLAKSIMYAPNEVLDLAKDEACKLIEIVSQSLIRRACEFYRISFSKEDAELVIKSIRISLKCSLDLYDQCGTLVVGLDERNTLLVYDELGTLDKKVIPRFNEKNKKSAMDGFIYINDVAETYCWLMGEIANLFASLKNQKAWELAAAIYKSLIAWKNLVVASAVKAFVEAYNRGFPQVMEKSSAAKSSANIMISFYNKAISDIEVKKIDAHYAAHPEEVEKMENDLANTESQIAELKKQINVISTRESSEIRALQNKKTKNLPIEIEVRNLDSEIKSLTEKMNSLGFFKVKERKALEEEIATKTERHQKLSDEAVNLRKSRDSEVEEQIKNIKAGNYDELESLKSKLSELEKRKGDIMTIKKHLDSKRD